MEGRAMFPPVLFLLLKAGTSIAVFFHEKSSVVLAPHDDNNGSFGFSLGYQGGENASLVIGAPLYDHTGRVYRRSIQDILHGNTTWEPLDIDFDVLKITYDRSLSPDQNFYLGASIAATENMFVTCAPLRTAMGLSYDDKISESIDLFGAYAACFTYDNSGTAAACRSFGVDYLLNEGIDVDDFLYGSSGWSSMIDKDKNTIIISKSFNNADLTYSTLNVSAEYNTLSLISLELENPPLYTQTKTNFGKAMTFGNYFDKNTRKTYYAFSLRDMSGKGAVDFFPSDDSWEPVYRLKDTSVGNMFGAALVSADVTRDGRADLLIGAPAQVADTRSSDKGAVHIYTRSDTLKMELKLTIWGVKDGGRFGSTLSTNDVDGDSYPEIFVSAPFENSGVGSLYILCGYEIHHLKETGITVSELKRTQTIKKVTHKLFGFSLQPVSDFNDNGSDELGVGAPGNSRVTLFSGVRAITVKVTSKFPDTVFPGSGSSYVIFSSCVTVDLPMKPKTITTQLLVKNIINGKGTFNNSEEATYEIDLASEAGIPVVGKLREYCRNISIVNASVCIVNTTVSTVGNIEDLKEFNGTWVSLSAQSDLTKSNHFVCVCPKPSCAPELTAELQWSGSNNTDNITDYLIGSSLGETVKVVVRNTGTKGCSSCAFIRVSGLDHQLQCQREGSDDPRYKCAFDSFMGNTTQIIEIQLVMDKLSNQKINFTVDVEPRRTCDEPGPVTSLTVPYDFTRVLENVIINGTSIDRDLADTEIQDESEEIMFVEQTYTIVNEQSFAWKNILVNLSAKNEPYIQIFRGSIKQTGMCVEYNGTDVFLWSCLFNLAPYSTAKMSFSATLIKKELANHLDKGNITIASELVLELFPDKSKVKTLTTVLTFKHEKNFFNDKTLVMVASLSAALLFLIIIIVILYKLNFFVRRNKQKLKHEIRRRSIRRESSRRQAPSDAGETTSQPCETVDLTAVKECNSQSDVAPSGDAASNSCAHRHEETTHAQFD